MLVLHDEKEVGFEGQYFQRQEGKTQGNFHSYISALLHCCYIYIDNWNNRIGNSVLTYPSRIENAQAMADKAIVVQ